MEAKDNNGHPLPGNGLYRSTGRFIRSARMRKGLTQDELAERIGLTRTSVTNIEKGRQKLLLHTFFNIASILDTSPADLLPQNATGQDAKTEELPEGLSPEEQEWLKQTYENSTEEDSARGTTSPSNSGHPQSSS